MKLLVQRYATPLITGLFLVSLISGIALFFHVGNAAFHSMHEWLSMVLILPFVLHLWRNWRPFTNYLGRSPMTVALAVSLAAAVAFAMAPAGNRSGPPQIAFAHAIAGNSVEKVAPLLGETAENLVGRLQKAGFTAADAQLPLSEIASRSGKSEGAIFSALKETAAE